MASLLHNESSVPSPALLIDLDAIEANLRRMIEFVGGDVLRLRPHVKTHKMADLVRYQVGLGILKFKCTTIAELEMCAANGAVDICLAMQLTGPNIDRFLQLAKMFPGVSFCSLIDDYSAAMTIAKAFAAQGMLASLVLDLNVGQNRTGITPGPDALSLYGILTTTPGLAAGGLHAYDGHLTQIDKAERLAASDAVWQDVRKMIHAISLSGMSTPPRIIMGGTPTFPFHAQREGVECSPGTVVLWDAGYASRYGDMGFVEAAWLLSRVISRPAVDLLCLDLGHKAVASEMPHPRVLFPEFPDAVVVTHSEEHLVLRTPRAAEFPVGSIIYGIPWHVCPTVALYNTVHAVWDGSAEEIWPVTARGRSISV